MWSAAATIVAIGIASNLDNAGVGIAYGVRKVHISWLANLIIAAISWIATFLSGIVGDTITRYVPAQAATWTGACVVVLVGLWVFTEPWRKQRKLKQQRYNQDSANVVSRILRDPMEADFDKSQTISLKEAVVLGVALALNALVGGFDAGVVHIGIVWTSLVVGVFSFVLLGLSEYLGRRYAAESLGDKATYVAGLLLILIGIHQLW